MTTTPDIFTASPRVAQAIAIAIQVHTGQPRMGTGLPYIVHPISVALAVSVYGDENMVIAALLHDAVEDTALTVKKVEQTFGGDVAWLVDCVTKKDGESKMDRVRFIATQGLRPVRLKLGDTRHNISDLPKDDRRYATYEQVLAVLESAEAIYLQQEAGA